jgi:SAM-dependent methyltransferase
MFHPQGPSFWELTVQALSSTERGYDLLAPKFEYTPFRTPDVILDRVGAYLATLAPFDAALDVCCGTGAGMRMLRPLCRQRVVGIDFSAGMVAVGRKLLADAPGAVELEFVRGNVLAMPFEGAFDLAVCFGALGHIVPPDQPLFVQQIARALRPGGRFVFVTGYRPPVWSLNFWWRWTFNALMHVRNWLVSPPFIMFYLNFLLPGAQTLLQANGYEVTVTDVEFEKPFDELRLVVARLVRK